MASQVLRVRWEKHLSTMQAMFLKSLKTGDQYTDVMLKSGDGTTIMCHRIVLAAHSSYFKRQLSEEYPDVNGVTIFLKDISSWQLEALITFMYTGEVNVTLERMADFFNAGRELEVKGLRLGQEVEHPLDAEEGLVGAKQRSGQPVKRKMIGESPKLMKIQRVEELTTDSDDGRDEVKGTGLG